MGVAYWLGGALDALVVGLGALLAALISAAIELYRHEVTMQEAIKFVERVADNGKKQRAACICHAFFHCEKKEQVRWVKAPEGVNAGKRAPAAPVLPEN